MYLTPSRTVSVNTLLADGDTLMSGGNLYIPVQGAGTFVNGVLPIIQPNGADRWFTVDSSINKLVLFKQSVFAGGRMKSMYHKQLNGICRQVYSYQAWHAASVTEGLETPSQSELTLYPNPGKGGTTASVNAAFPVRQIQVFDAAGRIIWSAAVSDQKQLSTPVPQSPGNYIVECVGAEENRASTMLTVE